MNFSGSLCIILYPLVFHDYTVKKMLPLEQVASLCTRNEFYLHVKFYVIRPFTMILSGGSPTKKYQVAYIPSAKATFGAFFYYLTMM